MSKQLQLRGGTTSEHSTFTGAVREVTVDTDKDTLVVHDGVTAGGTTLATEAYADAAAQAVVDSAPGALDTLNELAAALNDDANFSTTVTNSLATKLPLAGGTMTGAITFASGQTFDGRDVSADGSKLDGIESGADVTDTTNVVAALTAGSDISIAGDGTISYTGASDLVGDTTPQLGGDLDTNGNDITFNDNDKALFGATNDLSIYSDGTNAIIAEASPGNLYIRGDEVQIQNAAGTETKASFYSNGESRLHYDSTVKIKTTITGADVTGTLTADGLDMDDNHKILLGSADDLQIYHDGSNSYVSDQGTGDLVLNTTAGRVTISKSPFEFMGQFVPDGAVTLYYDNAAKFATTSTGINVTGTVNATTVDLGDWTITEDGSNNLLFAVGGVNKMKLDSSGNLTLTGEVIAAGTI